MVKEKFRKESPEAQISDPHRPEVPRCALIRSEHPLCSMGSWPLVSSEIWETPILGECPFGFPPQKKRRSKQDALTNRRAHLAPGKKTYMLPIVIDSFFYQQGKLKKTAISANRHARWLLVSRAKS